MSQARQAASLTAGITTQGDVVVAPAALDPATETLTLDDGAL